MDISGLSWSVQVPPPPPPKFDPLRFNICNGFFISSRPFAEMGLLVACL
jgi:hypothetical protein